MPGSALDGQADSPPRPFTCVLPVVQHSTSARLAQSTTSILSCHQGSRVDRHPQHPLREGLTLVASLAWPQLALCGVCTHKSKLEVPVSRNQSFALESEPSIADLQILTTCRTFHEHGIADLQIHEHGIADLQILSTCRTYGKHAWFGAFSDLAFANLQETAILFYTSAS